MSHGFQVRLATGLPSRTTPLGKSSPKHQKAFAYPVAVYLVQNPASLSSGFRSEVTLQLDHFHRDIAEEILQIVTNHVEEELRKCVPQGQLFNVESDFREASPSALEFEVEAGFGGDAAPRYEDLERKLATILISLCNHHNWKTGQSVLPSRDEKVCQKVS